MEAIDMIEQVIIKKTLKAGDNVWVEGSIQNSPLPDTLLEEVRLETGTVEVLKGGEVPNTGKLKFVAERVDESKGSTSITSQSHVESGKAVKKLPPPKQMPKDKPKPKLVRRKR